MIVFLWQLIPDRFPSRDDLFNRKVIIDHVLNACHICGDLIDSVSHLFIISDLVRSVWYMIFNWLGCQIVLHRDSRILFESFLFYMRLSEV